LPKNASLLVALSGGQDSMALYGLLRDLRSLHHWQFSLWHGNHGWRGEASAQAEALASWVESQGDALHRQQAEPAPATEAEARQWRYQCLQQQADALGCSHVLTAHTATDRAETLLLNLARGSHRRGLGALRALRPMAHGVKLVRPLLLFTREDTARICGEMGLPVWVDPSNADPRFSRNRLRAEVLPVLESLHPGAATRIAALAERLAQEEDAAEELLHLALAVFSVPAEQRVGEASLARRLLAGLQPANQRRLLHQWLKRHWGRSLDARSLEQLLARLPPEAGPGRQDLGQGWHLRWDGCSLHLIPPNPHGELP
jgi:tRNA(Ile)-lysidine synthase